MVAKMTQEEKDTYTRLCQQAVDEYLWTVIILNVCNVKPFKRMPHKKIAKA